MQRKKRIVDMKNQVRDKKSLGDRMKLYEKAYDYKLTQRTPVIMRLDGKAFHTFTRQFEKPYSQTLMIMMNETAKYLCENIQGAKIAYIQSDEITILIRYYDELNSEPWFNNEIQKMTSIGAAMASSFFTYRFGLEYFNTYREKVKPVQFDCRVFTIPEHDVCNNFIWRQQDWERNSIQMFGLSYFSQKELHKCSCKEIIRKCEEEKKVRWDELSTDLKRGRCIIKADDKWIVDKEIPIFKDDRDYIEKYLTLND